MRCRRCDSPQIQRDYDDATVLITLVGMRRLLCNTCGHVFNGFLPFNICNRNPVKADAGFSNRRAIARYSAHLPASISLINGTSSDGGIVTYTEPSKGHCETISKNGMGISLVGSRFPSEELSQRGRLLFVRVDLPASTMEGVVSILSHERTTEKKKWFLAVKIHQISDLDKGKLMSYLAERSTARPLVHTD